MKDVASAFDRLLSQMEPALAQSFLDAIQRIKSGSVLRQVEMMVERGDLEGLLAHMRIEQGQFAGLRAAFEAAFGAGGDFQAELFAGVGLPFNRRHIQAEAWISEYGGRLVQQVTETTKQGVRDFVQQGVASGRSSAAIARDIIGTVNRATGQRDGGVVGLTSQQVEFVQNARIELESLDRGFLTRKSRDRRYDKMVQRAIQAGKPLARQDIDKIIGRYADTLLSLRGNVIAETEAHRGLNSGRYEAARQNAENIGLTEAEITVKWQAIGDARTRDTHRSLSRKKVAFEQPFRSPSGALMRFPGDTSLGAPASETVKCRCTTSFEFGSR